MSAEETEPKTDETTMPEAMSNPHPPDPEPSMESTRQSGVQETTPPSSPPPSTPPSQTERPSAEAADGRTSQPATGGSVPPPNRTSQPGEAEADGRTSRPADNRSSQQFDLSPLEQAIAQRDKLQQQLVRTAADFDNYRKRARRDAEEASRRAKEEVLREVLPFVDNLERAVAAADSATDAKAVADGVRMVLRMFGDSAQRLGLDRIPSVGERFDPNLHDAIQQEETEEHPPGTIVREISSGYRFGPRLLRPAVVVVARPPASPSTEVELPSEIDSEASGNADVPADPLAEAATLEDPLPETPESPEGD